jgi:tetratricopeptide (TPR) repeat protein
VFVAKGLALRGARDFDGALRAFEEAFRATADVIHVSEQVRVLADAGRWGEAIAAWKRVAEVRPSDGESLAELAELEDAARRNAPSPELPPLDVVRRRVLGHGLLLPMQDATANILRQVGDDEGLRTKGARGAGEAIRAGKVTVSVSGREGPTNRLALALMLTGEADPRLAPYTTTDHAVCLVARGGGLDAFTLWREEADVAVQAIAPAPAHVGDWIEAIALPESDGSVAAFESTPDFLALWDRAMAAPVPRARARDWVAAVVHPRVPLERVCTTAEWVFRWQVVALLGLAASEPGWAGTEKREALLSLLRGAIDWPLAAAIRVAAEVALREPESTRELRLALLDIRPALAGEPNHAIAQSLILALEMLPYVTKSFVDPLRALLEADDDASAPPPPPAPPAPPATRRPWWKLWGAS